MNRRNAEPLDTETTIDMELVAQKSVEHWLKKFKQWDGTTKKSLLEKVLLLESFFARVFDPVHFTAFPDLAEAAITCEDGGDDAPGCGAEFYGPMPHCPFCTHSVSDDPPLMSGDEIAEYLIRVESAKVRGPAKAQLAVAKTAEQPPKKVEAAVQQIAPVTNAPIATVEELDAAVQRAVTTYAAAATNAYECAIELREIHERQLWRQRRGGGEQPKYAHFNNFVEAELAPRGIGRARAYGLIEMAKKFTRAEFDQLGPAKMNVILSLEEGPRKQLAAETVEQGLSLTEVREKKGELLGRVSDRSDTSSGRGGGGKPGPKAKGSTRKANATPEVEQVHTVVFAESTGVVKCAASKGTKKGRPAKSLDDLPIGEVEGVNGMRLRFVVSQAKDGQVQVAYFVGAA